MKSNYLRVLLVSIFTAAATVSATPLLDRLLHVLDLTESQITQLREAEERVGAVARRVESAVQLGSLSPEDGRAHIQAAREDLEAVMLEVLSDEQLARWRRSLETDRASDRESDPDSDHSTDRSPTPLLSHLLHVLDLTESQITQLREAEERVSAVARRVESAVHSGSLSPEDGGAHLQAARQDLEAVWQEVLSEEQLARWRQSLETDRKRDPDVAVDGEGATENSLTAPTTSVQERSWGQIKRERAR